MEGHKHHAFPNTAPGPCSGTCVTFTRCLREPTAAFGPVISCRLILYRSSHVIFDRCHWPVPLEPHLFEFHKLCYYLLHNSRGLRVWRRYLLAQKLHKTIANRSWYTMYLQCRHRTPSILRLQVIELRRTMSTPIPSSLVSKGINIMPGRLPMPHSESLMETTQTPPNETTKRNI